MENWCILPVSYTHLDVYKRQYYASANATLIAYLTRLFCSTHFDKSMKVGAAVAVARRGGITAAYDELNKFFGISGMPIASGQYWNGVHGAAPGEAAGDCLLYTSNAVCSGSNRSLFPGGENSRACICFRPNPN